MRNFCAFNAFLSILEPRNHPKDLEDADWIVAMQEELNEFERNKVWHLEAKPKEKKIIGLKWVFRNKLDEYGTIVRNKAHLVVKGYNQQEDDIIFGATNDVLCKYFTDLMSGEFEMSMMGELNFFLGLQNKQTEKGISIHQQKYIKELLKKYNLDQEKTNHTPMGTGTGLDDDPTRTSVDQKIT
ncbi:uncharacterized protein LOC110713471 [Chenopodium quinoa]|uniref:uncharacterized protein LOC110713471 n=1 Tax=Chenopodium quinoa TaxID=63459 RepID=UPI000B77252B|nr:uncharacterized protein LOC110713471 [Chenopodium quinoa]